MPPDTSARGASEPGGKPLRFKFTTGHDHVQAKVVRISAEAIPVALADITRTILELHRANGDLEWVERELRFTREPGR